MISFLQLPREVFHQLDNLRSRFFWQEDSEKKKYGLTRWNVVCRLKDDGGLCIHDLQVKNKTLAFQSCYQDGVWETFIRGKRVGSCALSQIHWKPCDSIFFGWTNGDEEIIISIWFVLYQGWLGNKVQGG
jgi:hypothetical protein